MSKPIDSAAREQAVSGQDKNLVVTAGAGTGKTTLLVHRMLHLLLGHERLQTEESPVIKIVAMTFTEKAACEMKIRLTQELEKIVSFLNGRASQEDERKTEEFLSDVCDLYQTTRDKIGRRARKSLEDIDKALIGTIHGFAAHILRLYPIESGVVPGFTVDEGDVFDELFDKEWTKWLEAELVLDSPHANTWKRILKRLSLESLKEFAKRLSGYTIPLNSLTVDVGNKQVTDDPRPNPSPHIQSLTDPLMNKINEVVSSCEKPRNNLLTQLRELSQILESVKKQGMGCLNTLEYDLDKKPSEAKVGWTDEGFLAAQEVAKGCYSLLKKLKTVDESFIAATIGLVLPFAKAFRQTYLSQGYVSFDGLLTLTRDLLQNKEHRYIREKLKGEFRAILVDEFQDTDPVQYEIVLFLSESLDHHGKDARSAVLEPGKLFIVGDPKQSIYAFRRADIEAYEQVVRQICGNDETLKLRENFRSHAGVIEVVNQLFDGRIMVEQPGLQPPYIPIHANRPKRHPSQKVEVTLVSGKEGESLKADEAREAEAEWIARWITDHVDNEIIEDKSSENGARKLSYRDITLLLRAFTQVRPYVEALKRYGIPYIVEGEKYFYTTQEILDFVNLLRIIENPHDTIALAGVLRSPIVGLTDREIYELKENHLLDYRRSVSGETPDFQMIVESFYRFLRKIHARAGAIPVSRLITEIMDNSHVAEITACAWHGEQKLANIWKLHQMACDMEQTDGVSLKTFIERIRVRIREAKEEGESPLSDETLDVVKVLSIHKSKGLEFPVVILSNLHGEVKKDSEVLDSAVFDWTTSTTGVLIGKGSQQVRNLQSIVIEKKLNDRSWEEEKRVLYVAMTRAKERLILTGALKDDDKSYIGLITKAVRDAAGVELGEETFLSYGKTKEGETEGGKSPFPLRERAGAEGRFPLGTAEVFVEHFRFDGARRHQKTVKAGEMDADWASYIGTWKKRKEAMDAAARTELFTSPSAISGEEAIPEETLAVPGEKSPAVSLGLAAAVGSVCHRVLEGWDFQGTREELDRSVELSAAWATTTEKVGEGAVIQQQAACVKAEALKILSGFIGSEAYKELQGAQILGREIPILLKWNGQIMRGVIDILYKKDDRIVIADYKTGRVEMSELAAIAGKYGHQKDVYIEAVKRGLGIDNPEFKLIFLRIGEAISV